MKIKKILFLLSIIFLLPGCSSQPSVKNFSELQAAGSMELRYAGQFSVDYLADGCSLISISDGGRFLVVPEGQELPRNIDKDITVLQQPVKNIYLAATSVMCLFDALDALDHITMSGTKAEGWYIENARAAMENGDIVYAGKYSAPDYEMIMAKKCALAIESTMILQTPQVKEKLEDLGVSVLVERSSYESHPLGRTEWIKLYGLLVGKDELAGELFDAQAAYLKKTAVENTGKTVAFFYISSSGDAVVRKNGDYVTKMIELAGGNYVFTDLGDGGAAGSVNLNMERFYSEAKDADFIIYNSSIDGEVHTIDELTQKNHLIADFKAVKTGNVWCTSKNLFQETTGFGLMIADMNRIFTENLENLENSNELNFLYKLQ
jgi:iron complex transport system substrate-binding protein